MHFPRDNFNMSGNNPNCFNRFSPNQLPYPNYPVWLPGNRQARTNYQAPPFPPYFSPVGPTIFQQQNNYYNNYNGGFMPEALIQAMNRTTNMMFNPYAPKSPVHQF